MDFERERFHHAFLWGVLVQETGTIKVEHVRYMPLFAARPAPVGWGGTERLRRHYRFSVQILVFVS
jgi:hypothetical protein